MSGRGGALRDIVTSIFPELRNIQGECIRMLLDPYGAFPVDLKKLPWEDSLLHWYNFRGAVVHEHSAHNEPPKWRISS